MRFDLSELPRIASAWIRVAVVASIAALAACQSAEQNADGHYRKGQELAGAGDLVKASLEFRQALQIKPDLVAAQYALGNVQERQGAFEAAVAAYRDVADRDAKHLDARVHLGRILLAANQLDTALRYADEALALNPERSDVLALKAAVALKLGNRFDAIRFGEGALAADAKNIDALVVLAAERLAGNDPKAALGLLDRASDAGDQQIALDVFRISALQALGDDAGIEAVFRRLVGARPADSGIRDTFARWYLSKGRKDDAEQVLRRFVDANPKDIQSTLALVDYIRREKGSAAARDELLARISRGGEVFLLKQGLAQLEFGDGNYQKAVEVLNSLVAETANVQNKSTARITLARMMLSKQDWSGAGRLAEAVLGGDSKNADALSVRAAVRVASNKHEDAITDLQAALAQSPLSPALLMQYGDALERTSKVDLADEQFAKAVRADPKNPAVTLGYAQFLLRYNKSDQAERVLAAFRTQVPNNATILSALAQVKLNKQDWLGAQEVANALRAVNDNAGQGGADQILAASLNGQRRYDESLKILEASSSNADTAPLAVLVRTYVLAGKQDTAIQFLKTVVQSNPQNQTARVLLGSLYAVAKQPQDAEETYRAAIDADPDNPGAYLALGQFLALTGRLVDAEAIIRKGIERRPKDNGLQLLLAMLMESTGKVDEAITLYEAMFAADPRATITANNLASLLSDYRTDPASLERAFQVASRFRTTDIPQFQDTLGWIYYLRGDYPQALTLLKAAADRLPGIAAVQYHLGMAYKALGQKAQALASLEKALSIAKQQPFPQLDKAQLALNQLKQ